MPCYTPPEPWAADARDDAFQAARILCALIRKQINPDVNEKPGELEILDWFIHHREIDIQINKNPIETQNARRDIELAKRLKAHIKSLKT